MDGGWTLGFTIGAAVVVLVVILVLTIIWLVSQIRDQTHQVVEQLVRAESATAPLWQASTTAGAANEVLAAIRRLRERGDTT